MATVTIVNVTTTAVLLLAANGNRKAYTIVNRGTGSIYTGKDNSVIAATGATLQAGEQLSAEADPDAIWAIAAAGTQRIEVLEIL